MTQNDMIAAGADHGPPLAGDPYAGKPKRQLHLVIVLMICSILASVDKAALALLFDPAKKDLGLTDTQMAFVYGMGFALANVLFTIPAGYLADRRSRRKMIAAGCAVWCATTALCGAARSFGQILATRSAVGVSEAVMHPTAFSMIRSATSSTMRGRAYSIYSMAAMIGAGLGFLIGGLLLQFWTAEGVHHLPVIGEVTPWRLVMLSLGIGGLPVALLMLTISEPGRGIRQQGGGEGSFDEARRHIGRNWTIYVPLFGYAATTAMQAFAYGAFMASIPHRVWGTPTAQVGQVIGLMQLVVAPLGLLLTGWLMDRLQGRLGSSGPALVGIATVCCSLIFSTAAPFAASPTLYFVLVGGLCVFGQSYFAVTANIVSMVTPEGSMGKVSAIQLFTYGLVGVGVGPATVGWASQTFFSGPDAIAPALGWCCAIFNTVALALITIVFFRLRARPERGAWSAPLYATPA